MMVRSRDVERKCKESRERGIEREQQAKQQGKQRRRARREEPTLLSFMRGVQISGVACHIGWGTDDRVPVVPGDMNRTSLSTAVPFVEKATVHQTAYIPVYVAKVRRETVGAK